MSERRGDDERHQSKFEFGKLGEQAAERFLVDQGFQILERGWKCPLGEIDLIARQGDTLVIVEVKTVRTGSPYQPWELVHRGKQRKLITLTQIYLQRCQHAYRSLRFDVVGVTMNHDGGAPVFQHFPHAFDASDGRR